MYNDIIIKYQNIILLKDFIIKRWRMFITNFFLPLLPLLPIFYQS